MASFEGDLFSVFGSGGREDSASGTPNKGSGEDVRNERQKRPREAAPAHVTPAKRQRSVSEETQEDGGGPPPPKLNKRQRRLQRSKAAGNDDGQTPAASEIAKEDAMDVDTDATDKGSSEHKLPDGPVQLPKDGEVIKEEVETIRDCIIEVGYPPGWEGEKIVGRQVTMEVDLSTFHKDPAKTYPFELDPFQKASVACLEKGESVLVSAHTSAGKTVVAEYAIAMSLRDKQRVIYTSPIKALSNQKYRELYEEFEDVGLMTGDVTINTGASCLVMTTEILRSMLYRGSEVMREVGWVIFDEIHYLRDKERGVVWEETIILLPDQVRYVFLSATIPNAKEFAEWIAKLHSQPCNVVYTDYRPTPLQHYVFPAGGDGLYLVVDEKGRFREQNFQKALACIAGNPDGNDRAQVRRANQRQASMDCYKIVKMIMERNYEPVIVFSFSKRECEARALAMSKLDFNSATEKSLVSSVFNNAIDSLSEEDKVLPQVESLLPLLRRGIGIHHSGLLPILKEVIEILFQEGLVKALFATETFSMGLNMPAKTVVFTSVRKFDGHNNRWITGGEYIQMSGRAGRRGKDDRGIVILMMDEKMEPDVAKSMLKGQSDPLISSFHLGYNMLLNLLRLEGIDPEMLMKRSFHQFQSDRALPGIQKKLERINQEVASMEITDEDVVAECYFLRKQLKRLKETMRDTMNQPVHALPFLSPGRLARVREGDTDWGWGVVVNYQKKFAERASTEENSGEYVVDMLLHCVQERGSRPRPSPKGEMMIVPVLLSLLDGMSSIRIFVPKDLRQVQGRSSVGKSLREVMRRFPNGVPMLDPIEDMQIEDEDFRQLIRNIEMLEDRLLVNKAFHVPDMSDRCVQYEHKLALQKEAKVVKKQLRKKDQVILKDELKGMKHVLKRLGFTSKDGVVVLKGRVACCVNAADELLLTEMIFNGVFNELTAEQIVALASCFIFSEKADLSKQLKDELVGPLRQMQEMARNIAKVSQECKLVFDEEGYIAKFKPQMMDVVYAWAKGAKFIEICKMTDVFEGSIIRCMRRLEELLKQLCEAAKAIGNAELEAKFNEGIGSIKRDIVFAMSLYL